METRLTSVFLQGRFILTSLNEPHWFEYGRGKWTGYSGKRATDPLLGGVKPATSMLGGPSGDPCTARLKGDFSMRKCSLQHQNMLNPISDVCLVQ